MLTIQSSFYNLVGIVSEAAFNAANDNDFITVTTVEHTAQGVIKRNDQYLRRLWEIDPS